MESLTMDSPHKGPVLRNAFLSRDVIMAYVFLRLGVVNSAAIMHHPGSKEDCIHQGVHEKTGSEGE